ncbi:MAG: hypothetical protein R2856_23170 [Caldilineaceae bacterium]
MQPELIGQPCRNFNILGSTCLDDPPDGREKVVLSNFAPPVPPATSSSSTPKPATARPSPCPWTKAPGPCSSSTTRRCWWVRVRAGLPAPSRSAQPILGRAAAR